jgi:hypothetical protein
MARSLDSALASHVTGDTTRPLLLVKAEFDSGTLYLWSGYGDLVYDSNTYTGAGKFLGISSVKESSSVRANGTIVTLSGMPTDLVSIALDEDYQERPVTIYFSAFDTNNALITPYEAFRGFMDVMTINEDATNATISVNCENVMVDLERPNDSNYTLEDQKREFSSDTGLQYIPGLQDKQIIWGTD